MVKPGRGGPFDTNWVTENGKRVDSIKYMTDDITDHAIRFIDNSKCNPFFMYLAYTTPHGPHQAKTEDYKKYTDKDMPKARKTVRAMYDSLDENIGRLLDHLNENNMLENTFIVYCADNGGLHKKAGCDNWKLRGSKGYLTEGGIRVPFIMSWPKQLPAGKTYTEPVINIDIIPTMLAAAGGEFSGNYNMDGVNLIPYLTQKTTKRPHKTLHWQMHYTAMNRWAIRKGDWKLVYSLEGEGLFNLREDVSEANDLRDKYPQLVEELTQEHHRWHSQNKPSRVTGEKRRAHIWELRFRNDMGTGSQEWLTQIKELKK